MLRLATSELESYVRRHAKQCRSQQLASHDVVDVG